jgi:Tfp pilus assembly protein PilO
MADLNVDIKDLKLQNLPKAVRIVIALLPAVLVVALVMFLAIMPKKEEIDKKHGGQAGGTEDRK